MLADARTILEVLTENEFTPKVAAPTQPLPSPGIIGRADVKATRRRGNGRPRHQGLDSV